METEDVFRQNYRALSPAEIEALKPCPFCGSESALSYSEKLVHCPNKQCHMGSMPIKAWNTRPTLAPAMQALELRKALTLIEISRYSILFRCEECGWKGHEQSVLEISCGERADETIPGCPVCGELDQIAGYEVVEIEPWQVAEQALTLPLSAAELKVKAMEEVTEFVEQYFETKNDGVTEEDGPMFQTKMARLVWIEDQIENKSKALSAMNEGEVKL